MAQGMAGVATDLNHGFRLGALTVEPLLGRVRGPSGERHLPPKAAEVLLQLAERPKETVPRQDLLDRVWGSGGASQEALSHAVSALRHALDDHPESPQYVQTLPRVGYRLLEAPCPLERGPAAEAESPGGDFLAELRRRGVVQTGIAYLVAGWLVMQVADVIFDKLHKPWLGTFFVALVIAGFPIALLLAWFIEIVGGRAVIDRGAAADRAGNRASRTYVAILGAMLLASAGVYIYDRSVGLPTELAAPAYADALAIETPVEPASIAVLPFQNIDGSEETRMFTEGLAEDLIDQLAKVPALYVSSRSDSFSLPPFPGSHEVRRRLSVAYYLEGSVERRGDQLRVVIQLIESKNGFHLLSRKFNRDLREFFELRDEIAKLTVWNLRPALPPETRAVLDARSDSNPDLDAYLVYRRGLDALHRPSSDASIREALRWFHQALELDPDYAAAHAGNCSAYVAGFDVTGDPSYIDSAERSCAAALDLTPNLEVVHNALGELYFRTGLLREAEGSYLRAVAANEKSVAGHLGLADVYHATQRLEDAERRLQQAIGLQPGNWSSYNELGGFLFRLGRYEEAADQYRRVIYLLPDSDRGYANLGAALMLSGNFADAGSAFARAIEIRPQHETYSNLGMMHYYLGQLDDAIAAHRRAVDLSPNDHLAWANLGDALSFTQAAAEARTAFLEAERLAGQKLSVNSADAETLIDLAWIQAMLGKMPEAVEGISRARELIPQDPYVHFVSALIAVRAGETAAAYEDLANAIELGYPLGMLAAEPHLAMLRGEPRFLALTEGHLRNK